MRSDDPFQGIIRRIAEIERRLKQPEVPIYNKGTWSPTYTGSAVAGATTYTLQAGFWRRVADIILFRGVVVWTAATGTGDARVSLPFTNSNATGNEYTSGSVRLTNVTFANSAPEMMIDPNTAYFTMDSPLTNANPTKVAMEAAGNIVFSGFFFLN